MKLCSALPSRLLTRPRQELPLKAGPRSLSPCRALGEEAILDNHSNSFYSENAQIFIVRVPFAKEGKMDTLRKQALIRMISGVQMRVWF